MTSSRPANQRTRVVLLAGRMKTADRVGHHDYLGGCRLLAGLLGQTPGVSAVVVSDGWPEDESIFIGANSLVFYNAGGRKQALLASASRVARIQQQVDAGAGLVAIHRAVRYPPELADRGRAWLGGAHVPGRSHGGHWWTHHDAPPEHPVARGVRPWRIRDGWLNGIQFPEDMRGVTPLVWSGRWHRGSKRGGARDVVAWAYEADTGSRAFSFTGLDAHRAWAVQGVRQLIVNGILWSAGSAIPTAGAPCALSATALDQTLTPREPPGWGSLALNGLKNSLGRRRRAASAAQGGTR